jgi:hypothetical protein
LLRPGCAQANEGVLVEEARDLAERWVEEIGGEALIFLLRTTPWTQIVRVAELGSRR